MPAAWLARLRPLRPVLALVAAEVIALASIHLYSRDCWSFLTRGSAWCTSLKSVRDSSESAEIAWLAMAVAWLAHALAAG